MRRSNTTGDVVLRLIDGRSEQHELVLLRGRPIPPLALGTRGGWKISAGRVGPVHVMLAWNGTTLFAGALGGKNAVLGEEPLTARWSEVRVPSQLRFGDARVSIGRRAGPDEETQVPAEETQVPAEEVTRIGDPGVVFPKAVRRFHVDDEVTCFDEERLQQALRLTRDEEVTSIAEVDVPSAAIPSSRPVLAFERAAQDEEPEDPELVDDDLPASAMPATIPSDGLVPVALPETIARMARPLALAVARPSQPTMAIPEPHVETTNDGRLASHPAVAMDLPVAVLAVSGERPSSRRDDPTERRRTPATALKTGWTQTSAPRKAIAILMAPLALAIVVMVSRHPSAQARRAPDPAATVVVAAPQSTVAARTAVVAPSPSAPAAAPVRSSAAAAVPASAPTTSMKDARSAERRALDAATSGQEASAAQQYAALAIAHPDNVAFSEAARIMRERAATRGE
jgi:hypothetical protein